MWNLFNCYLSGRHDYGMWCEPGTIFLRCVHCGKRSSGWNTQPKLSPMTPRPAMATPPPASISHAIPFDSAAAS
jgi:hypothetical protein